MSCFTIIIYDNMLCYCFNNMLTAIHIHLSKDCPKLTTDVYMITTRLDMWGYDNVHSLSISCIQ